MPNCTYENCENVAIRGSRCGHHSQKPSTEVDLIRGMMLPDSKCSSELQLYKNPADFYEAMRLRSAASIFKH
jgi:hypothetical protein